MESNTNKGALEKLSAIQAELKAPKGQYNSFGKYKYRSAEDILEAVKPICFKHKAVLVVTDDLFNIGDRYYIKAIATLYDLDSDSFISVSANAREDADKKGMDGSQITGAASSYARKYALNGLFNIDDTKDADTDEHKNQQKPTKTDDEEPAEFVAQLEATKEFKQRWASAKLNPKQLSPTFEKKYGVKFDDAPATLIRKAIKDFDKKQKEVGK